GVSERLVPQLRSVESDLDLWGWQAQGTVHPPTGDPYGNMIAPGIRGIIVEGLPW
ncbi:hypothetical protein SARC_14785, partial [Sphaeroforma arctica JP610]